MARIYRRDARGRFASASTPKGKKKPSRSVEARLDRSAMVVLGNDRKGAGAVKPGNAAKRREQHKAALLNYYNRLTPASQKRAVKKISAYKLFN